MNFFAWKIIPEGQIILDFSQCKNADDIHEVIKKGFGFPECYGENWDALWDFLDDFAISEKKNRNVQVIGIKKLPKELNEYLQEAIDIFMELEQKYPIIHFAIEINIADRLPENP